MKEYFLKRFSNRLFLSEEQIYSVSELSEFSRWVCLGELKTEV